MIEGDPSIGACYHHLHIYWLVKAGINTDIWSTAETSAEGAQVLSLLGSNERLNVRHVDFFGG